MRVAGRGFKLVAWLAPAALAGALQAGVEALGPVALEGRLHEARDLSAATVTAGGLLLVASDEDARIQLLDPLPGRRAYEARSTAILLHGEDEEIDLEALARSGDVVYALGSHSLVRPLPEPDASHEQNRQRIAAVRHSVARDSLFRLRLDAKGSVVAPVASISLRPVLERDPLLAPFCRVPGKENGVDLEGLAVLERRLFVGFRSPVLRSGHVPVMVLAFDSPRDYELRFLDLDGSGVRDFHAVEGGLLVLTAPPGGGAAIFFWDGRDRLPGRDRSPGRLERLGSFAVPSGAAAEGLALVRETAAAWEAIVVHDGTREATLVRIARPPGTETGRRPATGSDPEPPPDAAAGVDP